MLIEFSIVPIGASSSVGAKVAEVLDLVDSSGLSYKLTPMGTIVEENGRTNAACERMPYENDGARKKVLTRIIIDDRKGKTGNIDRKVVQSKKAWES